MGKIEDLEADVVKLIDKKFNDLKYCSKVAEIGTEFLGRDDRAMLAEVTGLDLFWIAPGGYIESGTMTRSIFEIEQDTVGFHISELEDEALKDIPDFIDRLDTALGTLFESAIFQRVGGLLHEASGEPVTKGKKNKRLRNAIDQVVDASGDASVTVVGRHIDLVRRSFPTDTNVKVIMVPEGYLPKGEVFVFSPSACRFAVFGGVSRKTYVESDNWFYHVIGRLNVGAVVARPDRLRSVKL